PNRILHASGIGSTRRTDAGVEDVRPPLRMGREIIHRTRRDRPRSPALPSAVRRASRRPISGDHRSNRRNGLLPARIFAARRGQASVLIASSLAPIRLDWKRELSSLSRLHRQMYLVYGGYVVLSIMAFSLISLFHAHELASRSGLARAFCAYVAI